MSISELGYFAYNFNIFASKSANAPWSFVFDPYLITVFLFITGALSILASRLLLMTVDMLYDEPAEEAFIDTDSEMLEGVPNLPSVLDRSAPRTAMGTALYFVFLMIALTALLKFALFWSITLEDVLFKLIESRLSLVCLAALLLLSSLSFYHLQYPQIACILLYIIASSYQSFHPPPPEDPKQDWIWQAFMRFSTCVMLFCNHLSLMSVAAASRISQSRQTKLLMGAVGMMIAVYLVLGIYASFSQSETSTTPSATANPTCLSQSDTSTTSAATANLILDAVIMLCIISTVHIRVRTIADVIVAWRYGLQFSDETRLRPRLVPVFLVALLFISVLALYYFEMDTVRCILLEPVSFQLATSTIMITIPYCYNNTVDKMIARGVDIKERAPMWWSYALYCGGSCGLFGYFCYFFEETYSGKLALSLVIDAVLAVLLLVWQLLGPYLP